ncbi:MAG: hypothetical protein P1U41_04205 [Vicingaceae bacterium]|nr:hypothetical protein [Vicingaceae bacterium]
MKKIYSVFVLSIAMIFIGCDKDANTTIIDNTSTSSRDNATAENMFADIKKVVEEAADDEGQTIKLAGNPNKTGYTFGNCATVTINPAWIDPNWPKVMEIDFGSSNCTGVYGVDRRGKLIVTLTGKYRDVGTTLTIQPQDYYVNDIKIEGTKTITNDGYNSNNNFEFSVDVVNGKLTYPDNKVITWATARINEWIEGDSTTLFTHGFPGICDDVYLITGSANGVNQKGKPYTVTITSPLRKEICCRWLVSGTLEIVPDGLDPRIVDFGTGDCDNQATVTINNNTYNIPMF